MTLQHWTGVILGEFQNFGQSARPQNVHRLEEARRKKKEEKKIPQHIRRWVDQEAALFFSLLLIPRNAPTGLTSGGNVERCGAG